MFEGISKFVFVFLKGAREREEIYQKIGGFWGSSSEGKLEFLVPKGGVKGGARGADTGIVCSMGLGIVHMYQCLFIVIILYICR